MCGVTNHRNNKHDLTVNGVAETWKQNAVKAFPELYRVRVLRSVSVRSRQMERGQSVHRLVCEASF